MRLAGLPFSDLARLRAPASSVAGGVVYPVQLDAGNLDGENNEGWTTGEQVSTSRTVANVGTLGGTFAQSDSAPVGAWTYIADAGDGKPELRNTLDDGLARLFSSLPTTAFAPFGPSGEAFSIHAVVRMEIDAVYSDGTVCATQAASPGLGGQGCALYAPWSGSSFGVIGQRGPEFDFGHFFDPPVNAHCAISFEHGGGGGGALEVSVNGELGDGDDGDGTVGTAPAATIATASTDTLSIGANNTPSAHPLRGGIRLVRLQAGVGGAAAFYAEMQTRGYVS